MDMKSIVYNKLLEINDSKGVDALTLSKILGKSRANISHLLNILCNEGKIIKSNSRPVLFCLPQSEGKNELDRFAELNISLKSAVEQAKAAILYPNKGIPTLLLGDTGVGKSMFAALMHNYAVEKMVQAEGSPFIIFNCADYSNNPQLLTAQLFGVKKGAYTGATTDKIGLLEEANGGILFLDEVHRLPPEGQETLFTFLDTGYFRRVGDNENRSAKVLIIAATTEDPKSTFLKTFIRRIPMMIHIPSLKERTIEERLYLVKHFFKQESIILNHDIYLSSNSMRAFVSYECKNNIGQLKTDIQLICAKAYSNYLTTCKEDIRIETDILPVYIREGLLQEKNHREIWKKSSHDNVEYFKFSGSESPSISEDNTENIYKLIDTKLQILKSNGILDIDIRNILEKDIIEHFQNSAYSQGNKINKKALINLVGEEVLECVDEIIKYLSVALNREFNNITYSALALHINSLIKNVESNEPHKNPHINKIKDLFPKEFNIALNSKKIIEKYTKSSISEDDIGYITVFILSEEQFNAYNNGKVKTILLAHGENTATSMANVANMLIGDDYTIAIDAPLDVKPMEILTKLKNIIRNDVNSSGYLLMVDMGSLITFGNIIETEFNVPVKVIPLISTLHVIEATRKAMLGFSLNTIYNDVLKVASYTIIDKNSSGSEKKKIAIITTCLTGEGGSIAVKSVLNSNLKFDKNLFEIITMNCLDKNYFIEKLKNMQKEREILFIVTIFPLDIDIPQYNIYDVINMNIMGTLQEDIDIKTTMIKMPDILKENITNIDGAILFHDILHYIRNIEKKLKIIINKRILVGMILHIAFMISRLKDKNLDVEYQDKDELINENKEAFLIIKTCTTSLNEKYEIEISDNDLCYILRFIINNNESIRF